MISQMEFKVDDDGRAFSWYIRTTASQDGVQTGLFTRITNRDCRVGGGTFPLNSIKTSPGPVTAFIEGMKLWKGIEGSGSVPPVSVTNMDDVKSIAKV